MPSKYMPTCVGCGSFSQLPTSSHRGLLDQQPGNVRASTPLPAPQPRPLTFAAARTYDLSALEDCAIGIDASYYLYLFLDKSPFHEPLLPALGGLTGIENHIDADLDQWQANKITPFFVFDGQSLVGQDEVSVRRARAANKKTDEAWELYFQSQAEQAVSAFGSNSGASQLVHSSVYGL